MEVQDIVICYHDDDLDTCKICVNELTKCEDCKTDTGNIRRVEECQKCHKVYCLASCIEACSYCVGDMYICDNCCKKCEYCETKWCAKHYYMKKPHPIGGVESGCDCVARMMAEKNKVAMVS